jgi:hypothetical protein
MKMLVDREVLEQKLNNIISVNCDRKAINNMYEALKDKGFGLNDINDFFSKRKTLDTLNAVVLCLYTIALYKVTQDSNINPLKFFAVNEIEVANIYEIKKENNEKFPIILPNTIKMNDQQYFTSVSIEYLMRFLEKQVASYNPETQRNMIVKEYKDKIVSTININKKSIDEMTNLMLSELFIPNVITFNIQQNGNDNIDFNVKNNILTINSGDIDIIDGWHRIKAMMNAYRINSSITLTTGIMFTNFDVPKAQTFIVQEDKRNQISKKYIKTIDYNNLSNLITKKINESPNSYLKDKITVNSIYIKSGQALILQDKLIDTIKYTFNPQENIDVIKQSKFIIEGLNTVIENNPDLLTSSSEVLWLAYIVKLSDLYTKNQPAENLNINTDNLQNINISIINKKTINELRKRVLNNE